MAGTTTEDVEVTKIDCILMKLFTQNMKWFVGYLGGVRIAIFSIVLLLICI